MKMPFNAWVTREDLVLELSRLEQAAGLEPCWSRARWSPAQRRGYDHWREALRDAYFSVTDPELRMQLIASASELDRRERAAARHQRDIEHRSLSRAKSRSAARPFVSAFSIGMTLLFVCSMFSGLFGLAAATLPAILISLGCLRDSIRRDQFVFSTARGAVSFAEQQCREHDSRMAPFSAQEIGTGIRDRQQSAAEIASSARQSARKSVKGSRDWVRPIDFKLAAA